MIIIDGEGKVVSPKLNQGIGGFVGNDEGKVVRRIVIELNPDHKEFKTSYMMIDALLDELGRKRDLIRYTSGV